MQNELVPHTCVAVKNQEGYLLCCSPQWECRVLAPKWVPQPRDPVLRKGVPITAGCGNQQELHLVRQRAAGDSDILLKGPENRHTHSQTFPLNSREEIVAQKIAGAHWEALSCLALGLVLEGQLSLGLNSLQIPLFLSRPLSTHCWQAQVEVLADTTISLLSSPST